MGAHIKCECCKYAQPGKTASSRRGRTEYRCGNRDSEYYGGSLNITHGGDKLDSVTWIGCAYGKPDNATALQLAYPKPAAV